METQLIIIIILLLYVIMQLIKSAIIGPAFSIIKWIIYGNDYIKWFKFKQSYIPQKKRANFSKNKIEETNVKTENKSTNVSTINRKLKF